MKTCKYLFLGIVAGLIVFGHTAGAASPNANFGGVSNRLLLLSAYHKLAQANSYHLAAYAKYKVVERNTLLDVSWSGLFNVKQLQRLYVDGLIKFQFTADGQIVEIKKSPIYIREEEGRLNFYVDSGKLSSYKWPVSSAKSAVAIDDCVKAVALLEKTVELTKLKVLINAKPLVAQGISFFDYDQSYDNQLLLDYVNDSDLVDCIVTIDNKTQIIKRLEVDLTACINQIVLRLLTTDKLVFNMKEKNLLETFASIELSVDCEFSPTLEPLPALVDF